jgi:acetylornithine deacetylase/succinyl-diaminopimelate desuccinylase-like protein
MRTRHVIRAAASAALLLLSSTTLSAQPFPTSWNPELLKRPDVKAAVSYVEQQFPKQMEEWIRLAEMPAKSTFEQQRGAYVKGVFEKEGLRVTVDSIGNVIGVRKGTGGGPTIVISAHTDIVHPMETNLKVRRSGDTLFAPGVGDNTASVADMLATLRAMNAAKMTTKGDIIFIGSVQEELGLKGMEYWLDHNPKPDLLIVPDAEYGQVWYGAFGIYWTKYTFTSAGSHTLMSRGKPTPVKALADAVQRIYALQFAGLPDGAVANVGQVHGGVIFNGTPQELYFTVDLRSPDPILLDSLDRAITAIVRDAAEREKVGLKIETPQHSRAGGTAKQLASARAHPLVQTAIDIHRMLGMTAGMPGAEEAIAIGATDANPGVVRKIPSIAIGGSKAANAHMLTEWALGSSALPATKALLLLTATFADGIKVMPSKVVP